MSDQPPYNYPSPPEHGDDQEPLYPPPGSQTPYAPPPHPPAPFAPYSPAPSQPLGLSPVTSQSLTQPGQTTWQAPATPNDPYAQQTPPAPYDPYAQYGPQLNAPTYLAPPSYQAPYLQQPQPHYPAPSQPLYLPQPQQPMYQQPQFQQPIVAQPMVIAPVIMPFTIATPPSIPGAGAALNSMVLGIIALIASLISWIPLLNICTFPITVILAAIGIITGIIGLRSTVNKGQAIAGLILSGIALGMLVLIILVNVLVTAASHH